MTEFQNQILYERLSAVADYYQGIKTLQNPSYDPTSQDRASGEFLDFCLRASLRNFGDVLHPDLSSIYNIFSPQNNLAKQGAYHLLEQIFDLKIGSLNKEITIMNNPDIIRPIVTIINTQGIEMEIEDAKREGGSHWLTLVILPKGCKGIISNNFKNKNNDLTEKVYLYDSLGLNFEFPNFLKKFLINGGSKDVSINGETTQLVLPNALDRHSEFIRHTNQRQQISDKDCGYWVLYNALMTVFEGSDNFWNVYENKGHDTNRYQSGLCLRRLFYEMKEVGVNVKSLSSIEASSQNISSRRYKVKAHHASNSQPSGPSSNIKEEMISNILSQGHLQNILSTKKWICLSNTESYDPKTFDDHFSSRVSKKQNFRAKIRGLTEPKQFFELFLTQDLIQEIVIYTNEKAKAFYKNHSQKNSHMRIWADCTLSEMKAFFTLQLHMGINKCPKYHLYWNSNPQFKVPGIATVMSRDRFFALKRHVYYHELSSETTTDHLAKIRPFFYAISDSCQSYWIATQNLSIDESMISFSGRHSGVVYIPRKPIPNGFKVYVLADRQGYVIKFKPSFCFEKKNHTVMDIINDLVEKLERKNYHLFMDK